MAFVDSNMKHWMRQLKIDPEKCCKKAKSRLLHDLDEQLGMGRIYLQHKKKKLKDLEYQVGMISAQITQYQCNEFHAWLTHQMKEAIDKKESFPQIIKETVIDWMECEKALEKEFMGAINTKRSQHWEKTGEML
tara:strand:- start:164 stop:565 length:402 start_codon:yes stop_codon:yes gene_type:complete